MEVKDSYVTKAIVLFVSLYMLVNNLSRGILFTYQYDDELHRMFYEDMFNVKMTSLHVLMIIVPAIAIVLNVISIVFTKINSDKPELKFASFLHEIVACVVILAGSAIYFEAFTFECAMHTVLNSAMSFILANAAALICLCYKTVKLIRSKIKPGINYLIPGMVVLIIFMSAGALVLLPVYRGVSGYDNYMHDRSKITEQFGISGYNSLNSGVTIDDTIYMVSTSTFSGNARTNKLMSIDSEGNIEFLDEGNVLPHCVVNQGDTVIYQRYDIDSDTGLEICTLNVKNMSTDMFSVADVSSDLGYMFGNYATLLGVREDHIYILDDESDEIWRLKICNGQMDKNSFEKYAWGVHDNAMNVCYSDLVRKDNAWPPYSVKVNTDDTPFNVDMLRVNYKDLGFEDKFSDIYLYFYWKKEDTSADSKTLSIRNVIAINVYKNNIYYAVVEDNNVSFYRSDLNLSSSELLYQYEADPKDAYMYASLNRLVVSDSYMVFTNSDNDFGYRVICF